MELYELVTEVKKIRFAPIQKAVLIIWYKKIQNESIENCRQ
jgi:hypothetical protein